MSLQTSKEIFQVVILGVILTLSGFAKKDREKNKTAFSNLISRVDSTMLDSARAFIQSEIEVISTGGNTGPTGKRFFSGDILQRLYQEKHFYPFWIDTAYSFQMIKLLKGSEDEGLDPKNYHIKELTTIQNTIRRNGFNHAANLASFDILLTDGLLLYGVHLIRGKVNPTELIPSWNISADRFHKDTIGVILYNIENRTIEKNLDSLKPRLNSYIALRGALKTYRKIDFEGGFPPIPKDSTITKLYVKRNTLIKVRKRLFMTGVMKDTLGLSEGPIYFDDSLKQALMKFQYLHSLKQTGLVDKETIEAMNVSAKRRIAQIKVNMEQIRWIGRTIPSEFIIVNISGFELYLVRNNKLLWTTNVMVGTVDNRTPVFRSQISYLVFNPTWTVPRSIINKSILPRLVKDRSYLERNHYYLVDNRGKKVDPYSINPNLLTPKKFPYNVVQSPGSFNSLGRVKFMFPNNYSVYLHDTPHKELFKKSARAFSHGCVRVQNPLKLAEILLNDQEKWSQDKILEAVGAQTTRTVFLKKKLEILLMYWTAGVAEGGAVKFTRDIYNRDSKIFAALESPDK